MLKNKKGSLQDLVLIALVVLFFGMITLFAFKITDEFNDFVQGNNIFVTDDGRAQAAASQINGFFPGVVDNTFLLFTIGIALVTLILALFVRIHPIFIPFFIIGLLLVVFISGIASNIYQEASSNAQVADVAAQLTFTSTILEFLPLIVGIFGFILMLLMYKLWKADQFV